ncbi:beta-galactosidase [Candidatus Saganbacteria bacterium]|nr:beta-galactosidase [Candidatus Saganbacteria bacterium]
MTQFGVTFYPDLYPRETWDREFAEIKKTGFEIVRFAEMAWDWIEPKEGDWEFEALDHALTLCQEHRLKVLLGVPVAQAPQWLVKKHPEILHVANDGYIHPEYGPRPNACRDNPKFREYAETLTRVMAQRYAKHPAVLMWQIDNEPGYPPLDLTHNKDYCHCESTRQAFVEWARKKYGSLEKLNEVWGTGFWTGTFSAFEEISTPKVGQWDAGNPHIYLDWYRFKSENLSAWLQGLKKIIREYDKERKIGTNSFTSIPNRIGDHSTLAQEMDWFGWDIYPKGTQNTLESLGQIADYWRSVCESAGAEFVVSELQGGPNVRWGYGGWVKGKEIKEWVRLLVKHGAKMILFHNWKPPLFGNETGGFGILRPDGTPTERLQAIKEVIREMKGNRGVQPQVPEYAIYYSKTSEIQTFQEEGHYRPCSPQWFSGRGEYGLFFSLNSIAGAYRLLWDKKVPASFVFDKELEQGELKCKVLLLANPYLLSRKQFENLLAFVKAGGTLVTESRFGLKDENAHLYPKPLLEELLNIKHLYTQIMDNRLPLPKTKAEAWGFQDVLAGCEKPAIIRKKLGKGKIVYATFSLFGSVLKWKGKDINALRIV